MQSKLLSIWNMVLLSLAVGGGLVGCGGGGVVAVVDPCPPLAAAAPAAAGASAPVSATGAYLCAAGVGVSNLEASVAFYKKAFAMKERARIVRSDRHEVVLDSTDDRGSRLVLMQFTDGVVRNVRQNPGKIVFYVKDLAVLESVRTAFVAAGLDKPRAPVSSLGSNISFGRDPDGNLVEIATSSTAVHAYLSAIGIGVSNLTQAKAFYVDTLDMVPDARIKLSASLPAGYIPVPVQPALAASGAEPAQAAIPAYNEYILLSNAGRGSAIVLMNYPSSPANYTNNPIKLTLRANDPVAYAARISAAGRTVTQAPAVGAEYGTLGNTVVGAARDADGTVLELLGP